MSTFKKYLNRGIGNPYDQNHFDGDKHIHKHGTYKDEQVTSFQDEDEPITIDGDGGFFEFPGMLLMQAIILRYESMVAYFPVWQMMKFFIYQIGVKGGMSKTPNNLFFSHIYLHFLNKEMNDRLSY